MYITQTAYAANHRDYVQYRGYYILTNHDESKLSVTENLKDILLQTASLCHAYTFIDNLLDCPQ